MPEGLEMVQTSCARCGKEIRGKSVPLGISFKLEIFEAGDPRATQGVFDFGPDCARWLWRKKRLDKFYLAVAPLRGDETFISKVHHI